MGELNTIFKDITIKKLKGDVVFSNDRHFIKELSYFKYYIISKEGNTKQEQINIETKKFKLNMEKKFKKCINKFLCFYSTKKCISLCFENNCFIFDIKKKNNNNNIDQENEKRCVIKQFLFNLLSMIKKIEMLFPNESSAEKFRNSFLNEKGNLPNLILPDTFKIKEIETEVSNLKTAVEKEYFKHGGSKQRCFKQRCFKPEYQNKFCYETFIIKSLDSIINYLIRRNYYESNSFKKTSFFKKGMFEDDKWENIFGKIGNDIDVEPDEIFKKKLSNIGLINLREISDEDIVILRHLANGSFSQTKLVIYCKTFKLLVQKVYLPKSFIEYDREKNIYKNFKYQHPNILKCYGYNETAQTKSLFLEFMSNDTLKTFLNNINSKNQTKITKNMKYHIIISLIFALEYLKNNKIIHRDLKPDNIFIDHDYNFYIGDFNASKEHLQDKMSKDIGSTKYSSPEIRHNKEYTYTIDIFSLGIITYEVLTGNLLPQDFIFTNIPKLSNEYGIFNSIYLCCLREERIEINELLTILINNIEVGDFEEYWKYSMNYYQISEVIKNSIIFSNQNYIGIAPFYLYITYLNLKNDDYQTYKNYILKHYKILENKGDPNVIYILGKLFWDAVIFPQDKATALQNYTISANKKIYFAPQMRGTSYIIEEHDIQTDINRAIQYLELSANQNNSRSQYNLGLIYLKGEEGIPQNMKKAIKYFELSANQNNSDAQNELGYIFLFGEEGIPKNISKALYYLELSANQNNSKAIYNLGLISLHGEEGIPQNMKKAIYYFELSANQNNSDAQNELGFIYLYGNEGISKNINKAIYYLELSANQNNSRSQYNLGLIYLKGEEGISKNMKKAIKYFELSANQNNSDAQNELGFIYLYGNEGISKNINKAIYYLELSATQNNSNAQYNLGLIYLCTQKGTSENTNKAIQLLELSANQNNSKAQYSLGIVYYQGVEGISKNMKKAIDYLELSANQNNSDSQYNLGIIYLKGEEGISKNKKKAIKYLELSANQNNSDAQNELGYIFLFGEEGIPKNISKALYYLELSANQNNSKAIYNLGLISLHGEEGIPQNMKKAIKYFGHSVNQNNPNALYLLGSISISHLKKMKQAIHYFLMASEHGNKPSFCILGDYHYFYENNIDEAIQNYKEASNFNIKKAKNNLGLIYIRKAEEEEGSNKSRDFLGNALIYFNEAAEKDNDEVALLNLALFYYNGPFDYKSIETSNSYINRILTQRGEKFDDKEENINYYFSRFQSEILKSNETEIVKSKYGFCYYSYNFFHNKSFITLNDTNEDFYNGLN